MSSPIPLRDRSNQSTTPQTSADAEESANDDIYSNPLWMVVMASACLFTILACLSMSG